MNIPTTLFILTVLTPIISIISYQHAHLIKLHAQINHKTNLAMRRIIRAARCGEILTINLTDFRASSNIVRKVDPFIWKSGGRSRQKSTIKAGSSSTV